MLTTPNTNLSLDAAPARHAAHDTVVDRRTAVIGLTVFAVVVGALGILLALGGATVFAAITIGEALLRAAEAVGVHRRSPIARRVAQGHCIVGAMIAGLSMPLGIIGVAGNAAIFRSLRSA